jgi:NTP pyrophosphatase (non-canonical NTP hydrolase)
MAKDSIKSLQKKVIAFRDARDWKQFHNPKDLALSLVLEAGEVMEHFQWKTSEEITAYIKSHKNDIADELADVLYWVLLIANDLKIDLPSAAETKLRKNAKKYPIKKAKGRHTKYSKL